MSATILCFGDSNTHGTAPLTAWGERGRYAHALRWTTHLAAALPGATVIAEGHPGRTSVHDDPIEGAHKNGLTVLPALLETHRTIDLVITMLGTNDCKARFSVTPLDIARSVDRLMGVIDASGCGPGGGAPAQIVVAPAPIVETGLLCGIFAGGAEKSRALAPLLAEVAAARGAGFLDAAPEARVSDTDGIHLTEAAHAALARKLAPVAGRAIGGALRGPQG